MTSSEVILTDKLFHGTHGTIKNREIKKCPTFPIDIHQKLFPLKTVKWPHWYIKK